MRFVHSLNTKPMFIRDLYGVPIYYRLAGTIVCSALSVSLLKVRGHKIVLHTDDVGKELMKHVPYDEVHLTINEVSDDFHPRFFASCKMFAMEKEPLNSIHIDNDVFLKRKQVLDIIENSKYDLLVQQTEITGNYPNFSSIYLNHPEFINKMGIDMDVDKAYNTGILNFRNQELKDRFINGYKEIVKHYSKNYKNEIEDDLKLIPDLIPEQKLIYHLSEGYNVHKLLEPMENDENFSHDIGYQHLITILKYTKTHKIMEMLNKVNPNLMNIIDKQCGDYYNIGVFNGIDLEINNIKEDTCPESLQDVGEGDNVHQPVGTTSNI